jgi:hypothetical protein
LCTKTDGNREKPYRPPRPTQLRPRPTERQDNTPHQTCFPKPVPFEISWSQGLQNPDGSFARSVVPAKSYDAGSHSTYLVSASRKGGESLTLWRVNIKKTLLFPGFAG